MANEQDLDDRLKHIRVVVLDVDGVLTDGKLTFDAQGNEYKSFSVLDGFGLRKLKEQGIEIAIITGRSSTIVAQRAAELGIQHVHQGVAAKDVALHSILDALQLQSDQVLYVGDDEPDIPAMQLVGVAVAVANAMGSVKEIADFVTQKSGGEGAVREVCERLLAARL